MYTYTNNWDSTKIYGCQCDVHYSGSDCSVQNCPVGDDPLTGEKNRCLTAERNECRNQKRNNELVEIAAEKGERRGGKR